MKIYLNIFRDVIKPITFLVLFSFSFSNFNFAFAENVSLVTPAVESAVSENVSNTPDVDLITTNVDGNLNKKTEEILALDIKK